MREDILDLLGNDVKIVDSTTRTLGERGLTALRFPGTYMPDGVDFVGEAPERLDPTILKEWCNAVRREFYARQNRKETAEADASSRRREASDGPGGGHKDAGADRAHPARDGEAGETSLEEYLKAEVAGCARRERSAVEKADQLEAAIATARADAEAARLARSRAERTLAFYLKEDTDNEVLDKDSGPTVGVRGRHRTTPLARRTNVAGPTSGLQNVGDGSDGVGTVQPA